MIANPGSVELAVTMDTVLGAVREVCSGVEAGMVILTPIIVTVELGLLQSHRWIMFQEIRGLT